MNKLNAKIFEIHTEGQLSLVKAAINDVLICAIIIDTPETACYLTIGNNVQILFKETEVVIAKEFTGSISIQNRLNCIIQSIEKGKILSKINMCFFDYAVSSLITTQALLQLHLVVGDEVIAMIKTNEVNLSPYD